MDRITTLQEEPVKSQKDFTTNRIKRSWSYDSPSSVLFSVTERVVTFCKPGGSSGIPSSPSQARRPEPRHSPQTTDPTTEADICGGLHFLTAHELKGKPTSVSSSSTRHTLLQFSCFAAHLFLYEPACGVKYINNSTNDNTGWWRLNLNFFGLKFEIQALKNYRP